MSFLPFLRYKRISAEKQLERDNEIRFLRLSDTYKDIYGYGRPITDTDSVYLRSSAQEIVLKVQKDEWDPKEVVRAYGRRALQAHEQTGCLSEVLLDAAEHWAGNFWTPNLGSTSSPMSDSKPKTRPLAGIPVSLKDSVAVAGYDSTIGYTSYAFKPIEKNAPLVDLLFDTGAIPIAKTTVPITLMSFESYSHLFGRTVNPFSPLFSPGGSSGGEGALLALGGSKFGIGTDVAGSVRIPAHYCGIVSVKASVGRFPKDGIRGAMPGQEGVPAVCSPMARTLEDLEFAWKAIVEMEPWKYDHTVLKMPWRNVELPQKVRFGVMWDDNVVPLSPACKRALLSVVDALEASGHEVVNFTPPDPFEGSLIAAQLLLADGTKTIHAPLLPFESTDPGMAQASLWLSLPRFIQRLYAFFVRYIIRDKTYATIVSAVHTKILPEHFKLVAQRDAYRKRWFETWNEGGFDFVLTAPNALPAVPHGGMRKGWKACGYTVLFNLLDYTAGVLPITRVSEKADALTPETDFKRNTISRQAFAMYDSGRMDGLPVGVQVVGRRLEEEKVLEGMKLIERVMKERGLQYV